MGKRLKDFSFSYQPEALFLTDGCTAIRYHELVSIRRIALNHLGNFHEKSTTVGIDTGNRFQAVLWMVICWMEQLPFVLFSAAYPEPVRLFRPDVLIVTSADTQNYINTNRNQLPVAGNNYIPGAHVLQDTLANAPSLSTIYERSINEKQPVPRHRSETDPLIDADDLFDAETFLGNINQPDRVFCGLLTSGSAGTPKKVPLFRGQMMAAAKNALQRSCYRSNKNLQTGDGTTLWGNCLPLHHAGGLAIVFRAFLSGTGIFLWDRFESNKICKDLLNHPDIKRISLVPTMLKRLLDKATGTGAALSSLQEILIGGGPASPDLIERAQTIGWPVRFSYGMTETCGQVIAQKPDGSSPPGSAGIPFPDHEISLRNEEDQEVAPGTSGSLFVRGPQVFHGYLPASISLNEFKPNVLIFSSDSETGKTYGAEQKRVDKNREIPSGWFDTGDFARQDAKGNLYIEDRRTDIVITGGENVSVVEIETAILECPGVSEAGVTGIPDVEWGQRLVALIVPEAGISGLAKAGHSSRFKENIITNLARRLKPHHLPKEVYLVDAIPRTDIGKIKREKLKTRAKDLHA